MIVTQILGNTHSIKGAALIDGAHLERVVLPSAALVKRIQRLTTDHGTELGLRLPPGAPDLRDGDVLLVDNPEGGGRNAVVVQVEPTDVLVIAPTSIKASAGESSHQREYPCTSTAISRPKPGTIRQKVTKSSFSKVLI